MGKALYRKYRSKSFDEVVGQEHITETLKNAIAKGAISHAYLFTGPKGVGKTSIARILAHAINDLPYNDESTHLDIIEIDAASNRRIDEIRDLRDKVHIAPTSAKYKVYIIDEVHMLTREAFNALLKTLEEPPEHAVFILATTEAHKVPETIISRTQRFSFKPIDESKAIEHLRSIAKLENVIIDDAALKLLANHGGGSFRDSISMLDQLSGLKKEKLNVEDAQMLLGIPNEELISNVIKAYQSGSIVEIFNTVLALRENGIDSGKAAIHISTALRKLLLAKINSKPDVTIIKTLKALLPITLTSSDFTGLELALIDTIDLKTVTPETDKKRMPTQTMTVDDQTENITSVPDNDDENDTNKTVKATKKIENSIVNEDILDEAKNEVPTDAKVPQTVEAPEEEEEEEEEEVSHEVVEFQQEAWTELLNEIKTKHNTLYGILRMGVATTGENGIEITFGFSFHKKQVDTPKNSAIVREFLTKYFGTGNFTTKVDNTKATKKITKVEAKETNSDPETIESVSNIFGGAELLE